MKEDLHLIETIARAIAEGFWEIAERPRHWEAHSHLDKEVWRRCARLAIAAEQAYRQAREAA